MKSIITAMILAASIGAAHADEWTGPDKVKHAIAGAAVGGITTLVSDRASWGCAASVVVGAGKEAYDAMHPDKHTASFKDFAVTSLAGCATAGIAGLVITPRSVTYSVALNLF